LQVDRAISASEGHFIAGFIEGEGHFGIAEANGGQSFRCVMSLKVRDDDTELVEWLRARVGVGGLHRVPARATSNPQVSWLVQTQPGCRALVKLLTRFEMRGRKAREFEIWKDAVELWSSGAPNRVARAESLRRRLLAARRFGAPANGRIIPPPRSVEALDGYLHGFLCAEGSLRLSGSHTALTVHLRQDDRPLLEMLADALRVGAVRDSAAYPPTRPSSTWRVTRFDEVLALAARLDPQRMRGRKAAELEIWLRAVTERRSARAAGRRARLEHLVAEFREARVYRPGRPPRAVRADAPHAETLRILRSWAESEPDALSCSRYAAARQSEWPDRNTIARRFGSWDAALRAAGLDARLPRPKPYRVGGAAKRDARAEKQRERVLATLRYGVTVHGSLPTAMQFFRWRLVEAPATPTQATVYRLFPGGWPAVLAAYDASGDQPSSSLTRRGSPSTTRS
jgi:hypothetical protein